MSCRCTEIAKCEQDIRLLANTLDKEVRELKEKGRRWAAKVPELSQDLEGVIFAGNRTGMETRLQKIKQSQDTLANAALTKCVSELTRVKNKRDLYEKEDKRYHEMMEQRARI